MTQQCPEAAIGSLSFPVPAFKHSYQVALLPPAIAVGTQLGCRSRFPGACCSVLSMEWINRLTRQEKVAALEEGGSVEENSLLARQLLPSLPLMPNIPFAQALPQGRQEKRRLRQLGTSHRLQSQCTFWGSLEIDVGRAKYEVLLSAHTRVMLSAIFFKGLHSQMI